MSDGSSADPCVLGRSVHMKYPSEPNVDPAPGPAGAPDDSRKALLRLSRRLFEIMEHLDPSPDEGSGPEHLGDLWDRLDDRTKRTFALSVERLLHERSDVLRVLEIN